MVDSKAVVILVTLMTNQDLTLYELTVKTKFSIKEIKDEIQSLNDFLQANDYPKLIYSENRYSIPVQVKDNAESIFALLNEGQVYLPQSERINLIYLYTFCRREFVSNNHYQDFLKVSKNTTLADIKALRRKMSEFHLELRYTRSVGYTLVGEELHKHQMAFATISTLLKSSVGLWALDYVLAEWSYPLSYEQLEQKVRDFYQTFNMSPILDRLQECLYGLIFILCRYQRVKDHVSCQAIPVSEQLGELTKVLVANVNGQLGAAQIVSKNDAAYFSLLLAASFEGEGQIDDDYFQDLTISIVSKMQDISILNFKQMDQLTSDLKRHLIPAYYRMRYGLPNANEYTQHIKEKYPELFDLVRQSLQPLAEDLGIEIADSEISYFVLHFGGYLNKGKPKQKKAFKAVIICPNGVSSSLIVKENLKVLFPKIAFQGISRVDQLAKMDPSCYDLIFSTIEIASEKPSYLVPMIMTEEQSYQLVTLVGQDFPDIGQDLETEQLMSTIGQYATVNQEEELRFALRKLLRHELKRKDLRPVLDELITEQTYQVSSETLGWKDAIRQAAQPLLESGQIKETYPEAMIAKVEEFGPFINLGKGIAIPHARPEDGVNAVGMSMLVLEKPIYLLDDPKQEIFLLICIAAIDNETHLKALSHLTTILRDKKQVQALLDSRSYEDIKEIIKEEA
ncbi:BglG family transcription antiterminator [Streptococcus catagoni]|uniref:BglG family transcription antiterminator n=1 Tax=Streptococcus catagoni TaxID=2654874 RepID=UPI00140D3401|nr:BglG family transcription antiterminator [Streptococcus catagoni]